jgi:hypothetical protein
MGFVRVRGKAKSEQVLRSPVSHSLCCFCKVEIDQWKSFWQVPFLATLVHRYGWLPFLSGRRDWDGSD